MYLKRGDSNQNVCKLQLKLGLNPDGDFGPKTEVAVRTYQTKYKMNVDGIVTDSVWNLIMGIVTNQNSISNKKFDYSKLKNHIPLKVYDELDMVVEKFKINTPLRMAHFLAQCSHESMEFKTVFENLNYSSDGLLKIFSKYFTKLTAIKYARNPELIANKVYGNRMGNGDENSGDGWKYRGKGYIQLTGKNNYTEFNKFVSDDVVTQPELVATKYPLLSAGWFFHKNNINNISDMGSSDAVVTSVTKRVNGGTIGIKDRLKHFNEYYKLLA